MRDAGSVMQGGGSLTSKAAGDYTRLDPDRAMLLSVKGVGPGGIARHSYRLAVPAGYAVSILNAVPGSAAIACAFSAPESVASFELQVQDLAAQFERFCARRVGGLSDCHALTLFVDRADYIEDAVAFGKRLRAGTPLTVIATLDDARWRVALNAYFLERV